MPASNGSAIYVTASGPNRLRTNSAIDSSSGYSAPRDEQLGRHPQFCRRVRRASSLRSGLNRVGKPEHRGPGQRMQPAVAQDERRPRKLRREQTIANAKLVAQHDGRRLLHEQRVGSGVDDESPTCSVCTTPPGRDSRSSTTTDRWRLRSSYAADSPETPPPTTATSTDSIGWVDMDSQSAVSSQQSQSSQQSASSSRSSHGCRCGCRRDCDCRLKRYQRGERPDERRRGVQRLRAAQADAGVARRRGGLHIDIEQDFGVVAHKADRCTTRRLRAPDAARSRTNSV